MNPRTTGFLFLVAAALGAFVWLYEIEGGEARKAGEEVEKRLFPGVESGDVEWIALTTADGHAVRIERQQGGWRFALPLAFRADGLAVDGLAASLVQLASETRYPQPQPPEVYGLGDGAVELVFGVGGQEHRVRIGAKTPMGGNSYVSVAGSDEVHAVRTYRVTALAKRLEELRDKRIVEFETDAVQGVTLRWPEGGVVLAREAGEWRLREPIEGKADASSVDSLLSNLSYLRASGFEDAPPSDEESGLEPAELEIELTLAPEQEGGEPRRVALAMGKALPGGDRLVRAAGEMRFRVPEARIDDFPRQLVAWRFKDVTHFDVEDARRIEMSFRDASGASVDITATRAEDETWSSAPEAMAPDRIQTLVDELARLRARDILADEMGPEELRGLALEPPNASLIVHGAEGPAPLADLRIGVVRDGGGIVAQGAGNATVFELDPAVSQFVPVS
ncbi:MAG: DUF4340 domain-containing protein, partial [Myxococcales bacterium]